MSDCKARWEELWTESPLFMCGGSRKNPDPCVLHGCGELSVVDPQGDVVTTFYGSCRCPMPEEEE